MASGGGSLDQIDSKYMINEAEDIIKKIRGLETDDKEHEESDEYSSCLLKGISGIVMGKFE
jgi:hypothetical protein